MGPVRRAARAVPSRGQGRTRSAARPCRRRDARQASLGVATVVRRLRPALIALAAGAGALAVAVGIVVAGVQAARHLVVFGVVAGSVVVGAAVLAALAGRIVRRVPRRSVVELDLPVLPGELRRPLLARLLGDPSLTLHEVVDTIERAGRDARVDGLLVTPRFGAAGLAQIQELRDALADFRARGKFAVAFADSYGEGGAGNAAYYLATACDEVVLQPTGTLGLVGLAREATFLRQALDRLAVEPLFEGRREYKSAISRLLDTAFTGPDREQQQRIVDAQLDQIVRGIAAGRRLEASDVRRLVDAGPFLAEEALRSRLVDRLAYRDEVLEHLQERTGRKDGLVSLAAYRRRAPRERRGAVVALVTASGTIARRAGEPRPGPGGRAIDATTTAEAIRRAAAAKAVKAILVRLDSPGGSPVASDTIHRAIARARQAGTPVVVSMGNLAASGGYYLAVAADRLVAQPGTITGSIGVFAGKLVLGAAKARLGVTTDEVHAGEHALIASANRGFSETERERFTSALDTVYADFLARVAQGRKLGLDQVEEVARGRVWTGADAHEHGLVDALGGFPEALRAVRELAGLAPDAPVRLRRARPKQHGIATLVSPATRGGASSTLLAALAGLVGAGIRHATSSRGAEIHLEGEAEDWFVA